MDLKIGINVICVFVQLLNRQLTTFYFVISIKLKEIISVVFLFRKKCEVGINDTIGEKFIFNTEITF